MSVIAATDQYGPARCKIDLSDCLAPGPPHHDVLLGALPFTGSPLLALLVFGLAVILLGLAARRLGS